MANSIDHPAHYANRNLGYECIDLACHQSFCVGNAIKYLWRYKDKENPVEDLKKARWYATRASQRQEQVNLASGQCNDILLGLITVTRGDESAAWTGLLQRRWTIVLTALDMMIEEEEDGSNAQ